LRGEKIATQTRKERKMKVLEREGAGEGGGGKWRSDSGEQTFLRRGKIKSEGKEKAIEFLANTQ